MKTIYLDQNKWIDLARRKKNSGGTDPIYTKIKKRVESQEWCIPISAIHLIETLKRADKRSRADVLDVMVGFSMGHSLLSFIDVEESEVINAFAEYHNAAKRITISPVRPFPFYAIGAVPTLSGCENLPPHIQSELHSILALCMTKPKLFYKIISVLESPRVQQSDIDDEKDFLLEMDEARKDILSKPKPYRYKIYVTEYMRDIFKIYYGRLCSIFGLTRETLLPPDALSSPEKTMAILESMPSVDIRIKLHYDLLIDKSYTFQPHDEFDILFLSTAVPYSDIVVTERTWKHRVIKMKLSSKYNTLILDSIEDLSKIPFEQA